MTAIAGKRFVAEMSLLVAHVVERDTLPCPVGGECRVSVTETRKFLLVTCLTSRVIHKDEGMASPLMLLVTSRACHLAMRGLRWRTNQRRQEELEGRGAGRLTTSLVGGLLV